MYVEGVDIVVEGPNVNVSVLSERGIPLVPGRTSRPLMCHFPARFLSPIAMQLGRAGQFGG